MRKNFCLNISILAILFLFGAYQASAATITVNTLTDENNTNGTRCSLREAINNANNDNTTSGLGCAAGSGTDNIVFSVSGTISLSAVLPEITTSMNITGGGGGAVTISGNDTVRVLSISNGTVSINNLTITDGFKSDQGGAINNGGQAVTTLSGVTVSSSNSGQGGGLENDATMTIINSSIVNNQTSGYAAGIANFGTLTISGSNISGNISANDSGAIINYGSLDISNSTFSGNSASEGSGITHVGSSLSVDSTTFVGNISSSGGMLMISFATGNSVITNSTFNNNPSTINGSTVEIRSASATLRNCTISGNSNGSAALYISPASSVGTIVNTIIAGNTNSSGTQQADITITNAGNVNTANSFNNLIGTGGSGGLTNNVNGNKVGVANPGLAPLGNYGGSVQTMALLQNSPAVNAGRNASASGLTNDQRGAGAPRIIGGTVDIGAFERNITFNQATLPNGRQNQFYNITLTAARQTSFAEPDYAESSEFTAFAPTTFALVPVTGQSLPPGLSLASNGTLSGTPTANGTYNFTVKTTDTDGMSGTTQYALLINPPTASSVSISGRVMSAFGRGVSGAVVAFTNAAGETQSARTNSFGYYRFESVAVGETYIFSVSAKRYSFAPEAVFISEELENLNFAALP